MYNINIIIIKDMNSFLWEMMTARVTTITQCGMHLTQTEIQKYRRHVLNKIMKGLNKTQKQIFKLLWGYYRGVIFNQREISNLLGISEKQLIELERQSNLIVLRVERMPLFRYLYRISN